MRVLGKATALLIVGIVIGLAIAVPSTYYGFPRTVTQTATVTKTVTPSGFLVHILQPKAVPHEMIIGAQGRKVVLGAAGQEFVIALSNDGKALTITWPATSSSNGNTYLFEATLKHGNEVLAEGQKIANLFNTTTITILLTWKGTPNPNSVTDIYMKVSPVS